MVHSSFTRYRLTNVSLDLQTFSPCYMLFHFAQNSIRCPKMWVRPNVKSHLYLNIPKIVQQIAFSQVKWRNILKERLLRIELLNDAKAWMSNQEGWITSKNRTVNRSEAYQTIVIKIIHFGETNPSGIIHLAAVAQLVWSKKDVKEPGLGYGWTIIQKIIVIT